MLDGAQNVLGEPPVGVQVPRALGHPAHGAVLTGDEDVRVRQDEHLGEHLLDCVGHAVLVGALVQGVASVE